MSNVKNMQIEGGHGYGGDSGAVNQRTGRRESDDTLRITQETIKELRKLGYGANSTRTSDNINIAAVNRIAVARSNGAVCYVEWHRNDSEFPKGHPQAGQQNPNANGFETFTKVNFSRGDDRLAQAIHNAIIKVGVQSNRGVKRNDFGRLVDAGSMPSCLIEMGFIGNDEDNRLFDKNLKAYAKAVANAIASIFPIENSSGSGSEFNTNNTSSGRTKIAGVPVATAAQMTAYIRRINPNAPDLAELFLSEGKIEGIRGDIAFAQSCLETGNFMFVGGTAVTIDQNNFCGMGVVEKGVRGNSYKTPKDGIQAQIQHLKAYANELPLVKPLVTPTVGESRFLLVQRGVAPYVEWLGMQENPQGRGWAASAGYGEKILDILIRILETAVSNTPATPAPTPKSPTNSSKYVIGDALEIFKFLAGLDNRISESGRGSKAWNAALITEQSKRINRPQISDAVAILQILAGNANPIPNANKFGDDVLQKADDIVRGLGGWGNDPLRRERLIAYGDMTYGQGQGVNFRDAVQKRINEIMAGK